MPSRETELRDLIATELTNQIGSLSIVYQVITGGPTYHDVDESTAPRVFVTCLQTETVPETREMWVETYKIAVTVTDYLQKSTQAELDDMIQLCQEIRDYLRNRLYPQGWNLTVNDSSPVDLYDVQVHETKNFYVSYWEYEYQNHVPIGV